ncbi:hypothetical protein [Celerinatantimonas yamalensis]|uniref:Lipoprotein n=1 Tax=Celerinatantimonas yamalensis TaxID=559956 RepID=A0ABW9GBC9_9GAMM
MKYLFVIASLMLLAGCASQPKPIKPVPFDNHHSFAYNIASQTNLLDDHSPLRDFTPEEVKKSHASLHRGHSVSTFLGIAEILTGNLTGAIDVAGGEITDMSLSGHTAGRPRWIVYVPKADFKDEITAQNFIRTRIITAAKKVFGKYGHLHQVSRDDDDLLGYNLTIDGKDEPVGLTFPKDLSTKIVRSCSVNIAQKTTQTAYCYGFSGGEIYVGEFVITTPFLSVVNVNVKVKGKEVTINPSTVFKDITRNLPGNFFLYMPSYPRVVFSYITYTDLTIKVPTIYWQGKAYPFIKPTQK